MEELANRPANEELAEQQKVPMGFEDEDAGDMIIPRIKVIQTLSPERKDKLAEEGDIINSLTKEKLNGKDSYLSLSSITILTGKTEQTAAVFYVWQETARLPSNQMVPDCYVHPVGVVNLITPSRVRTQSLSAQSILISLVSSKVKQCL